MPPRKRTQSPATDSSGRSRGRSKASGAGSGGRSGSDDGPQLGTEQLGRNPDAHPVQIHRDYVQRRLGGGALPTPDAYERAIEQWHRLGGAVSGPVGETRTGLEAPGEEVDNLRGRTLAAEADEPEIEYDGPLPATDPDDRSTYERGQR